MTSMKRRVSWTLKRENSLEIQERIYPLAIGGAGGYKVRTWTVRTKPLPK
jgi:hypothetical protein